MGEASTSAGVSVLLRSNVITETENETAMQQINYLESKEVLGELKIATLKHHQGPTICITNNVIFSASVQLHLMRNVL